MFSNNPRHLWQRYLVALVLISLSIIVLNFAPKANLNAVEASAEVIDTAGRQRMLSQRMLFLATRVALDEGSSKATYQQLRSATSEFALAQKQLSKARERRDRAAHSEELLKLDRLLDEKVAAFVKIVRDIETDLKPTERQALLNELIRLGSEGLLGDLDSAVQRDEKYILKKVRRAETLANAAFILALVVMGLSVLLIFLPSHRTILKFLEDRNTFETTLLEKNQELEEFTYVASHDLRAPLRGMENLVNWIDTDLPEDTTEETLSHLVLLRSRILRMNGLLSDMLAFAKIGKTPPDVSTFGLRPAIEEVVTWVDIPDGFTVNLDPIMPMVTASRTVFQQIGLNLLKNAIRHHDKDTGRVDFKYSVEDDRHIVVVSDDGPGIPAEYREYIFKAFKRLEARDKVEGSGIGLSITRKLVASLGGTIELVDPPKGETRGSTFRLSLPIREPSEVMEASAAA